MGTYQPATFSAPSSLFGCTWVRHLASDRTRRVDVYQEDDTGTQYAVKTLDLKALLEEGDDKRLAYVKTEVLNHYELLQHPHVIQFHDIQFDYPHLFIKMELAKVDLHRFVQRYGPLQEPAAQWLFLQLLHAVDYCHRKRVCNRDIKPSNILLDYAEGRAPTLKLCDLGYSKRSNAPLVSLVGTLAFVSPEVLQAQDGRLLEYDPRVDVWGCGVTLYYMLTQQLPFGEPSSDLAALQVRERILRNQWEIPGGVQVTEDCRDLLRRMLCPRDQRARIDELWGHPWVQRHLPQNVVVYNQHLADRPSDALYKHSLEAMLDDAFAQVAARSVTTHYDEIIHEEIIADLQRAGPMHNGMRALRR